MRNKKKEVKRGDIVKNDRQAMKILGLLENSDKKEVIVKPPSKVPIGLPNTLVTFKSYKVQRAKSLSYISCNQSSTTKPSNCKEKKLQFHKKCNLELNLDPSCECPILFSDRNP